MILCRCDQCVYQQDGHCLLSQADINEAGVCSSCLLVNLPSQELQRYKDLHREDLRTRFDS